MEMICLDRKEWCLGCKTPMISLHLVRTSPCSSPLLAPSLFQSVTPTSPFLPKAQGQTWRLCVTENHQQCRQVQRKEWVEEAGQLQEG